MDDKNYCEECDIEINGIDDLIIEQHTKRTYCKNCGAYFGDFKICQEKENVVKVLNW